MVDPKASRFWQAGVQSSLIDADSLGACWDAIPEEKRAPDQVDRRLARQAVQAGLLTLWQAQQLLAGRSTGFKIDRYILLEMIGQGGMGRVYLARDSRLNRRVALKILSPERVNNPRAIQRFQREARVGAQLQHENLVRIYDEGESNGKCYLVMEFIEGKNLGALIAEHGPMAPATAARLTRQVALGLEHAQLKGLIHRDVNPYNILMTKDGVAKLTDLGLAIDLSEQVPVTRDGATVGTFDYVSPEQARHSHSVDTRSDIYSLGCTLYHLLSGQVPFPSPSLPEKLFGHQAVEPEPLTALVPGIPEGLSAIVQKMMRKSPDDRYATPLELAQVLEPYIGESVPGSRDEAVVPSSSAARAAAAAETRSVSDRPIPAVLEIPTPPLPAAPAAVAPLSEFAAFAGLDKAPKDDLSGLGLALDFGPAPALSEGTSRAKAKPAPAPPPPPEVKAPAPEVKPRPAPVPPPAPAPAAFDFGSIGGESAAPAEDLSGLGLGLDFGPAPALSEGTSKAKMKAKPAPAPPPAAPPPAPEVKARPVETSPPAPAPTAKAKPAPPTPPPPSEPMPDFGALAGDAGPKDDLSGLGLGLNFGPEPPLSESKPKPKAKPAPAPPPPVAPAATAPAKPALAPPPPPPASPIDFLIPEGPAPSEDLSGLGLGLNFGPEPPLSESKPKPKAKPAPTSLAPSSPPPPPAPELKAKPVPPPPAPQPVVPMPDFSALSGEAPAREDASGLGLGLNFGPEPPLSESKAAPRPKAKPAAPPPPVPAPAAVAIETPSAPVAVKGGNRRWLLIGAAAALLLAVGGVVASGVFGGPSGKGKKVTATAKIGGSKAQPAAIVATKEKEKEKEKPASDKALVAKVDTPAPVVKAPTKKIEEVPRGEPLAVRSPDGTITTERGFKSAMQRAIGSKGHVLLNNRAPLKFAGDDAKILIGGGPLYIRAADGVQPVLEVEIKGNDPFIMTRTDTPITLVGVTIVVHYVGQDDKKEAPALIEAGGNVRLEHCSFRVVGAVKGSRAVTAEGVNLTATGCWFEGFDKALDVAMFAQTTATLTQCMMVRAKADDSPLGWALRVRDMPGGPVKSGRQVILTNCTASGKGFLEVVNFSSEHPLKVDVKECAVQADALLAWETPKDEVPLTGEALTWSGTGNQFDLRGKSWVVLGPDAATPLPDGPADLTSWTKRAKQEVDTVPPPIKFASEPGNPPQPAEFAVPSQGIRAPGANPAKIGPTAPPTAGFGTRR